MTRLFHPFSCLLSCLRLFSVLFIKMKLEICSQCFKQFPQFSNPQKKVKEFETRIYPGNENTFLEGKRQRLLKRIKTDNVDCDGHLGEDFHLKNICCTLMHILVHKLSVIWNVKWSLNANIFSSFHPRVLDHFIFLLSSTLAAFTSDVSWQTYCHFCCPHREYIFQPKFMELLCLKHFQAFASLR